jgi:hypothetical protein
VAETAINVGQKGKRTGPCRSAPRAPTHIQAETRQFPLPTHP